MHRLVLAQVAAMTLVLGEGGGFVLKLFDVLTPCTASLYYVAHKLFRSVTLLKPLTSRPASSERYMVCTGFLRTRAASERVSEHLLGILAQAARDEDQSAADGSSEEHHPDPSIGCAVPFSVMEADAAFVAHLRASNDALGARQLAACEALLGWAREEEEGARNANGARASHGGGAGALRRKMLGEWGLTA